MLFVFLFPLAIGIVTRLGQDTTKEWLGEETTKEATSRARADEGGIAQRSRLSVTMAE